MRGHGQEGDDSALFAVLAILAIALVVGWFVFKPQIIYAAWMALRFELWLVLQFLGQTGLDQWLPDAVIEYLNRYTDILMRGPRYFQQFGIERLMMLLSVSGKLLLPMLWLAGGILLLWAKRKDYTGPYRGLLDLEGLIRVQTRAWPRVRPILNLRSDMKQSERGGYTYALDPVTWAVKHNLVSISDSGEKELLERRAWKVLEGQLGDPVVFREGDDVSIRLKKWYHRALFAFFVLRIEDRMSDADYIMDEIGRRFPLDLKKQLGYDFPLHFPWHYKLKRIIDGACARYEKTGGSERHKAVLAVAKMHGPWANVFLSGLMERCKNMTGIVSTSDFIWLKPVDRTCFYACNQVYRPVAFAEAQGVRGQILENEKKALEAGGWGLWEVKMDTTARSLREELEDVDYTPPKLVAESLVRDLSQETADKIEQGPQAGVGIYRQLYGSDKMYFMVLEVEWLAGADRPELTGICLAPAKQAEGMAGGLRLAAVLDEDGSQRLDITRDDARAMLEILERSEHLVLVASQRNALTRAGERAKPSAQIRTSIQMLHNRLTGTTDGTPAAPEQVRDIVGRLNALLKEGRFHTLSEVLFADFGISGDLETVYTNVTGNQLQDAHDAQAALNAVREISKRLLDVEVDVMSELETKLAALLDARARKEAEEALERRRRADEIAANSAGDS